MSEREFSSSKASTLSQETAVNVDRDSPMVLPSDLRKWVPADHIIHFIADSVDRLDLSAAKVNIRGTGSAQYPPRLMIGLLLYSYATGTFSSRRIEKLTYENVAVRYLCCDLHPDHDSICKFRRENEKLIQSAFHQILRSAVLSKLGRVGDIILSVDGTRVPVAASEQLLRLEEQIRELLAKAKAADSTPLLDGLSIPEEIQLRGDRLEKMKQAMATIEKQEAERQAEEKV